MFFDDSTVSRLVEIKTNDFIHAACPSCKEIIFRLCFVLMVYSPFCDPDHNPKGRGSSVSGDG